MPNSANVDERVVEMRIDNRQFVAGAEKTISILDKLKDALSFKSTKNGFDDIQKSADNVDLSGMAKDIEAIAERFSSMGIVGMSVIKNLTDTVTNFVKSTVKGLTLDPITSGFSKYEEVARSTATILAATRKELDQFGSWGSDIEFATQLDYVKNGLETLTWYADETSAAMTDMVNNIGKFTNAGVRFENAVVEMMGVTNWGYQAGAGKAEQARAMYNLSQALATGSVRLMDWRSIENANMATIEFKETVLETAAEMGALKKQADGTYKTLDGMAVSATNFGETLSKGWFTSGVLEQTLIKYGEYSRRLNAVLTDSGMKQFGITAYDVMEAMNKLSDASQDYSLQDWHADLAEVMGDEVPDIESLTYAYELLTDAEVDLSRRAFLAGQEYRTFGDVLDAVKDAVSSGWMRTFEMIIGDTEEAKQVWTALGDELNDIFAGSAATRNAILSLWKDPNQTKGLGSGIASGRDSLLNALAQLYAGIRTYIDPIVSAFKEMFKIGDTTKDVARKLLDLTYRFEEWTSTIGLSEDAMEGMYVVFHKIFGVVKSALGVFKPVIKVIGTAIGYVKDFIELFFESFATGSFDSAYFMDGLYDIFGGIVDSIGNAWEAVKNFANGLKDIPIVGSVLNGVISIADMIAGLFGKARENVSGIVDSFDGLEGRPVTVLSVIRDLWDKIWDAISNVNISTDKFKELFGKVGEIVSTVYEGIVGDPAAFKERIKNAVLTALGGIKEALQSIKISDVFEGARAGTMMYTAIQFAQFVASFKSAAQKFETIPESITNVFKSLSGAIDAYGKKFKGDYMLKMAAAILAVAGAMWILAKIDQHKFAEVAVTLAFFFVVLGNIAKNMSKMQSQFSNNNKFTVNILPKFAAGLIAIAILLGTVAVSLLAVSSLGWGQIAKGLVAIGVALGLAVITLTYLSKKLDDDINIKAIGKLVAIAMVIKAAGKAMSKLSDMSWGQIISAGVALGIVIAAVSLAMRTMSKMSVGSALGSIAGALSVILVMYTITPLLVGITKMVDKYGTKLLWSFGVLVGIGALLIGFSAIMAKIASKGGLVKGAAALALIGVAFVGFAAALTLSAPAILLLLNGFVNIMERLSEIPDIGWLVLALLGMGAALEIVAVAAGIFGAALLLAGAGMALFGAGLVTAAAAVTLLTVALVPFGAALTEFCNMVAENGSVLIKMVSIIVTGIIAAIAAARLKIAWTTVLIILTVIEVVHEYGPQILSVLATVLEDALKFLITLIPMIIKFVIMAIVLVIDGAANAIRDNSGAIVSAIENLVSAIIELFLKVVIQMVGDAFGSLWGLIGRLFGMSQDDVNAITSEIHRGAQMLGDAAATTVNNAFGGAEREASGGATAVIDSFSEGLTDGVPIIDGALGQVMDGVTEKITSGAEESGSEGGESLITSFVGGVDNTEAMTAMTNLATQYGGVFDMTGNAETMGENFAIGNANGLLARKEEVGGVYANVAAYAANRWASAQQIASPSKLAFKYGGFWTQGIVNGLEDGAPDVFNANETLAIKMVDAMRDALATVQTLTEQDFDLHPTITPVVDMSGVDSAANSVNGMFSSNANNRMAAIGRNMTGLESVARDMRDLSEARANITQDRYEINIYTQPGMDEELIADAVLYRLSNGIVRKGAALG